MMDDGADTSRERLAAEPGVADALSGVTLPSVLWPKRMFGLADVRALQLIEALENADCCVEYRFAAARGGWEEQAAKLRNELRVWTNWPATDGFPPSNIMRLVGRGGRPTATAATLGAPLPQ